MSHKEVEVQHFSVFQTQVNSKSQCRKEIVDVINSACFNNWKEEGVKRIKVKLNNPHILNTTKDFIDFLDFPFNTELKDGLRKKEILYTVFKDLVLNEYPYRINLLWACKNIEMEVFDGDDALRIYVNYDEPFEVIHLFTLKK